MNGRSKKVWGWYPAGNIWLPLRCNALGQLEVDLSNVVDDVPVDGMIHDPISSNWAFDHNAAERSGSVHPSTAFCWAYMAGHEVADYDPHPRITRLPLDTTAFDPGGNFHTGIWQQGVGDAGSNATTIKDADPTTGTGFTAAMKYALVTWDAGASKGVITSVDLSTQVTIVKTVGANFGVGDTYTIMEAHYVVPASGYYRADVNIMYQGLAVSAGKFYSARLYANSVDPSLFITSIVAAAAESEMAHGSVLVQLTAGDLITIAVYHQGLIDARPLGTTNYSYLRIEPVQIT